MYKRHLILFIFVFADVLGICFFTKPSITVDMLNTIMTTAGIIFGFLITALSTLFDKKLIKKMASTPDTKTALLQTRLHTLTNYFKHATYSWVTIIALITVNYLLSGRYYLPYIIIAMFVVSLVISLFLLDIFLKSFLEENQ